MSDEQVRRRLHRLKFGDSIGFETPSEPRPDTGYVVTEMEQPLDEDYDYRVRATRPTEDGATYDIVDDGNDIRALYHHPDEGPRSVGVVRMLRIIEYA